MSVEKFLNRKENLFLKDFKNNEKLISKEIIQSKFLIIGAAGSIGQAVATEIFKNNPKKLHLVDLSENNMVELVRSIRSSYGYIKGEFKTFEIDVDSIEFEKFYLKQSYDYIFNFSALKHVRSEKDPYTLMRLFKVNVLNPLKIIRLSKKKKIKKFFNVSTDKASEPANMMGASKRLMEISLISKSKNIPVVLARFANVLFSDGSLLSGFKNRMEKNQPLSAPKDIKRYFITSKESAYLCIITAILGNKNEIFYPKIQNRKNLISFSDLAIKFLKLKNFKPVFFKTENSSRKFIKTNKNKNLWPCYFFNSDTTGEKKEEIFYSVNDKLNEDKFTDIGIISDAITKQELKKINLFIKNLNDYSKKNNWKKKELIKIVQNTLGNFNYIDKKKHLNEKM